MTRAQPPAPAILAPAVKVDALSKHFEDVAAVDTISFTVAPGETVGLLGGNGAGKTTTISMLLGLVKPSAGSVLVHGIDMARDRTAALHRMNFESPYVDLPKRLSVEQNLVVFGKLYGLKDVRRRVRKVADELKISDLLKRQYGTLSAGQRTRVSLAKSLINEPDLLLLDEPTASLDPDTADWVRSYLEAYQKERNASILLASHNMQEVERMCDNVLMMRKGKIVDRGSPATLLERYGRQTMEDVFLDIARERRRVPDTDATPVPTQAADETTLGQTG